MPVEEFNYGGKDSFSVRREPDGSYSLWFDTSQAALAFDTSQAELTITHLNKTALVEIKKTITERQRNDKEVA